VVFVAALAGRGALAASPAVLKDLKAGREHQAIAGFGRTDVQPGSGDAQHKYQ